MRVLATFAATVAGCIALAAPSGAAIVNVNCATQSLQARIDAAAAGDTLRIKGTCVGRFVVGKTLTLAGNPRATLDAAELGRTLQLAGSPSVVLRDLTITGGRVLNAFGAGIEQTGGSLTLRRVTVAENTAVATGAGAATAAGGGLASTGGTLAIRDAVFRGNTAVAASGASADARGGGIYRLGTLRLESTRVTGNVASGSSPGTATSQGGGIYASSGDVTLSRSRLTGNRSAAHSTTSSANGLGGGLFLPTSNTLVVSRSIVSGNAGAAVSGSSLAFAFGGGLVSSGPATLRDSTLHGNAIRAHNVAAGVASAHGGAAYLPGPGSLVLRTRVTGSRVSAVSEGGPADATAGGLVLTFNGTVRLSTIAANVVEGRSNGAEPVAGRGGGVFAGTTPTTFDRATVDRNRVSVSGAGSAQHEGAGIYSSGAVNLLSSTVSRNAGLGGSQGRGGGLFAAGGAITNSTVASNRVSSATARGGGLFLLSGTATLTSSTIARNTAGLGGGIAVAAGTTTIRGTIVAANSAQTGRDCEGTVASSGFNLVGSTAGCTFTPVASDRRNVAARLAQLRANGGPTQTIALRKGSPARNAIPKAQCPVARDQRGVKRPQQKRCEIGAYERRP